MYIYINYVHMYKYKYVYIYVCQWYPPRYLPFFWGRLRKVLGLRAEVGQSAMFRV